MQKVKALSTHPIWVEPPYTTESVLQGHPDKVCDQIADAILDEFLSLDEQARVAIECLGCGTRLIVAGEVSSALPVDIKAVAMRVYRDIGYTEPLEVVDLVQAQSQQLRHAVDSGTAGDQGIMYGFACASGYNYLPRGVLVANTVAKEIDTLRHRTSLFRPDGKVQVTLRHDAVEALVVSVQHDTNTDLDALRDEVLTHLRNSVDGLSDLRRVWFNHQSRFISGGFANDTGLSGRKQAVDTYCGLVPHGGGSFSGKDPSKVDRSAAYMARYVAKSIVANGLAPACLIAVAYVFGEAEPVMIDVRTEGSGPTDVGLTALAKERFDFRVPAITERLGLRRVRYARTATYGHFCDPSYPWEQPAQL